MLTFCLVFTRVRLKDLAFPQIPSLAARLGLRQALPRVEARGASRGFGKRLRPDFNFFRCFQRGHDGSFRLAYTTADRLSGVRQVRAATAV